MKEKLMETSSVVFEPISIGNLCLYVAETFEDILSAQKLRYEVFAKELGAQLEDPEKDSNADPFDAVCDHLIVKDTETHQVVGTYRLGRHPVVKACGSFYTASEFDLTPLLKYSENLLELSRSCVAPSYRTLPTMQLLWRGLAEYALAYNISFFFGCASFQGVDPTLYAHSLSYLYYNHLAPEDFRPRVLPEHYIDMRLLPVEEVDAIEAIKYMPPLIKGYLRIGGFIGDGIFVDCPFNTTDVCIVVQTDQLTKRYANHFNARSTQEKRFTVHEHA